MTLILARNYAAACERARELGLASRDWRFIDRVEQLYGYNRHQTHLVFGYGAHLRPDAAELLEVARTRGLYP